jgi:hypothetical protein
MAKGKHEEQAAPTFLPPGHGVELENAEIPASEHHAQDYAWL